MFYTQFHILRPSEYDPEVFDLDHSGLVVNQKLKNDQAIVEQVVETRSLSSGIVVLEYPSGTKYFPFSIDHRGQAYKTPEGNTRTKMKVLVGECTFHA